MTITNVWKLFRYAVKRDHYGKLIGKREFLEQLYQYFFKNIFSPDSGTPEKNIPPLDKVYDGDTVSTCRALNFTVLFLHPQQSELCPTLLSTVPTQYLLDISILTKKKKLKRKRYITELLEVSVQGSCLMEIYASRETFVFARDAIGSIRRCTRRIPAQDGLFALILWYVAKTLY